MKKLLAIILTFTLVGSVLTGCGNKKTSNDDKVDNQAENVEQPREVAKVSYHKAAESFAGGSGTKEDPFQISEVGHLVLLNDMLKTEAEEINFDKTSLLYYCVIFHLKIAIKIYLIYLFLSIISNIASAALFDPPEL